MIKKQTISLLGKSLIDEHFSVKTSLLIIIIIGVLPNIFLETERPFDPFLLLLVPAWIFYMLKSMWQFTRNPNNSNWEAILGLSYTLRKEIIKNFLLVKTREGMVIILSGLLFFCIVRLFRMEVLKLDTSFSIAIISAILTPCICLFSILFYVFFDFLPRKRDIRIAQYTISWSEFDAKISQIIKAISTSMTTFLPKEYKAITRRFLVYLLRLNLFQNVLTLLLGMVVIFAAPIQNNPETSLVLVALYMYVPMISLFSVTPCLTEANRKIKECVYYTIEKRKRFMGNVIIAHFVIMPYIMAIIIHVVWFYNDIMGHVFIKGLFIYFFHILVFSHRWTQGNWNYGHGLILIAHIFFTYLITVFDLTIKYISISVFLFFIYFISTGILYYSGKNQHSLNTIVKNSIVCILIFVCGFMIFFYIVNDPTKAFLFKNDSKKNNIGFLQLASENKYYTEDFLIPNPPELLGNWILQYDKTVEAEPWIINDSTVSTYDEDSGKRSMLVMKCFKINNEMYLNCRPFMKTGRYNQYTQQLYDSLNAIIKPHIDDLGNLSIYILNHNTVSMLIKRDTLDMPFIITKKGIIYSCKSDQWVDFLKTYSVERHLFCFVSFFRRQDK